MVLLPGGTFYAKDISKTVTIAPFWLDVTEVTAGAYRACVVAGKCTDEGLACDELHPVDTYRRPGKENHPINCVNQAQAMAYCAFVGKRLPTGAEWEWAARGTKRGTTYPWGDEEPSNQIYWKRYNYQTNQGKGTCPVHSFPRGDSPQGIADLAGNVAEWTTSSGRESVHGGDWMEADPGSFKASVSDAIRTDAHGPVIGFRCAGDGPAASP
jgi:formylglycine-generating enzyme required for sulfatase activity